jgi:hypothetical protein
MHGTEEKACLPNDLFSSDSFVKNLCAHIFALICDSCSTHPNKIFKASRQISNHNIIYDILRIIYL